jgi:hypothetical protein
MPRQELIEISNESLQVLTNNDLRFGTSREFLLLHDLSVQLKCTRNFPDPAGDDHSLELISPGYAAAASLRRI